MPTYTETDFKAALRRDYAETLALAPAVAVIDSSALVVYCDTGFGKLFECDPNDVDSLASFIPKEVMPTKAHNALVAMKIREFTEAIAKGEHVEASAMGGNNRVVAAVTAKGNGVSISVSLCCLAMGDQSPPDIYLAGFLTPTDNSAAEEVRAKAAGESQKVVIGAAANAIATAEAVGNVATRGWWFIANEVLHGVPGNRLWAGVIVGSAFIGLGYLAYIHLRGPSNTNIRIERPAPSTD